MNNRNAPSCCAQVGILVLHKCGKRAVGTCDGCALPFCSRHLLETETGERMCPSCIEKVGAKVAGASSEAVERYRRREDYYRSAGYYHPYYYDQYYYYDDDYAMVEHGGTLGGEETDGEDSIAEDDYDFTES